MKKYFKKKDKGFTLFEILISLAILSILAAVAVVTMKSLSDEDTLDSDASTVVSAITKARVMSINGDNALEHGIAFGSSNMTLFQGKTVLGGTRDAVFTLGKSTISAVSLSNGTTSFYFNKITGQPSATGTVTVTDNGVSKQITIYSTGIAE